MGDDYYGLIKFYPDTYYNSDDPYGCYFVQYWNTDNWYVLNSNRTITLPYGQS